MKYVYKLYGYSRYNFNVIGTEVTPDLKRASPWFAYMGIRTSTTLTSAQPYYSSNYTVPNAHKYFGLTVIQMPPTSLLNLSFTVRVTDMNSILNACISYPRRLGEAFNLNSNQIYSKLPNARGCLCVRVYISNYARATTATALFCSTR